MAAPGSRGPGAFDADDPGQGNSLALAAPTFDVCE